MRLEVHGAGDASEPDLLPEWIHLSPAGPEVQGRDGRAFEIAAPADVLARTEAELPMLIDWDHDSMFGSSTQAAGWIDRVAFVAEGETDADRTAPGFWGHVELWTPQGARDVRDRRYRMLSPVIRHQHREADVEGEETPAPLLLNFENAALTNRPNLRMASLNAEAQAEGIHDMTDEELAELLTLLGLDEGADGAAVIEAVRALTSDDEAPPDEDMERASAALRVMEGELRCARERLAAIDAERAESDRAERIALVEAAIVEGRALPAHRDDLVRLATGGDEDRATFARLTAQAMGAPRGRVTGHGEARPSGAPRTDRRGVIDGLTDRDRHLYVNLTRGMGWSHDRALAKLAERAEGI